NARLEISADAFDHAGEIHGLELRVTTDSLEAMRYAIEAFQIGAHVGDRGVAGGIAGSFLEELDPATEAGERRAELVCRPARHAGPQPFSRGVTARPDDVESGD